ncbi:MAG: hypothetical protein K0R11_311 [Acidimicrobiales bacterium]|nr:hypothetical protein [Acidimicrobiales bacterium]
MIAEHPADCGALYRDRRRALLDLVGSLGPEELGTVVPATPAWTVHDVVAHLVGITADLNALRFDVVDAEAWTARQVAERRTATVPQLAVEWEAEADRFEEGLRLLGYELGSHYVGDLLQHSQDVREALGRDRLDDDLSLVVALDFYVDHFSQALVGGGAGAVVVRVGDESWTAGAGEVVATVTAGRFELLRAFGGRRTEAEVRALGWTGDVDRVLPFVSAYP